MPRLQRHRHCGGRLRELKPEGQALSVGKRQLNSLRSNNFAGSVGFRRFGGYITAKPTESEQQETIMTLSVFVGLTVI